MVKKKIRAVLYCWLWYLAVISPGWANDQQATALVKAAVDYWRDISSYSVMDIIIHRPEWERTMTVHAWTRGEKEGLARVTSPKKDAGNSILIQNDEMWTFNPKINRVIKIPPSMMGQSWMGSDFSNNDISKADAIVKNYHHKLITTETHAGQKVHVIEAIPLENAPEVWGKQILKIRADFITLEQAFYDQDNRLVKTMATHEIKEMGGKTVATRQRMQKAEANAGWTEIVTKEIEFKLTIPDSTFTLSNLRNPRF